TPGASVGLCEDRGWDSNEGIAPCRFREHRLGPASRNPPLCRPSQGADSLGIQQHDVGHGPLSPWRPATAGCGGTVDSHEESSCLGHHLLVGWSQLGLEVRQQLRELSAFELMANRPGHEPAHTPAADATLQRVHEFLVDGHRELARTHTQVSYSNPTYPPPRIMWRARRPSWALAPYVVATRAATDNLSAT